MADQDTPAPPRAPSGFTNGQLEFLKWIALASMFLDHFGRHLLGYGNETWVFALGRIAFPLFTLVLALNLAREGERAARAARTARRLALWCLISVPPSIWARGEPMLVNVLGTLALGAALCWALSSGARLAWRATLGAAVVFASPYVEFGLAGVVLIPGIYLWSTSRAPVAAVVAATGFLMTGWLNVSHGGVPALMGTLVCLPLAWAVSHLPVSAPRLKLVFYLVYPLHLALIGALKTFT
jgi:hypothetical protein